MNQEDVSFTFLHRVEEVELNAADKRWQSALALALTLPDICGAIAFPEIVRHHRDGRVILDRQRNPARDVGGQYIRWFDAYASEFFKLSPDAPAPYICGARCWQLRCEYLHQNKGFLNDEGERSVQFHLGVNCGTSVCQAPVPGPSSDGEEIRIDIQQFCLRMCQAARRYYDAVHLEKDFSLYNTPVLDFVQATQGQRPNPLLLILCENEAYANGLRLAVQALSGQILLCSSPAAARQALGRRKPAVWIITDEWLRQPDQPWRADGRVPVVLLTRASVPGGQEEPDSGKQILLSMPVRPQDLRSAVTAALL